MSFQKSVYSGWSLSINHTISLSINHTISLSINHTISLSLSALPLSSHSPRTATNQSRASWTHACNQKFTSLPSPPRLRTTSTVLGGILLHSFQPQCTLSFPPPHLPPLLETLQSSWVQSQTIGDSPCPPLSLLPPPPPPPPPSRRRSTHQASNHIPMLCVTPWTTEGPKLC